VPIPNELLQSFFDRSKLRFGRCLAPGMNCENSVVQAHSVQNSQILALLVRDGHVKALTRRIDKNAGPVIDFNDVGRNQATTFDGFCASHDSEIFIAIDTRSFQADDPEHLFLSSYRAIARELHTLMEAAVRIQASYQDRIKLGFDNGNEPEPVGMLALEYMVKSYSTYQYKCSFDQALIAQRYGEVLHDVVHVSHERANVAVCSLFSIDHQTKNGDYVRIALNVLPENNEQSVVVFGYLPEDGELVRPFLRPILTSEKHYQKYLLSKLILNNCENFVVSPASYDDWPQEKRNAIRDYFVSTLLHGNLEAENEHFYLF
jgi:hypothetical protein